MGHPVFSTVRLILNKFALHVMSNKSHGLCIACQLEKSQQLSFSTLQQSTIAPLEILYSDMLGPSPVYSNDGHN